MYATSAYRKTWWFQCNNIQTEISEETILFLSPLTVMTSDTCGSVSKGRYLIVLFPIISKMFLCHLLNANCRFWIIDWIVAVVIGRKANAL